MSLPSPQPYAPLKPGLAFVVQLQSPVQDCPEQLAGRVEHIASGQTLRFASLDELCAFFGKAAGQEG